MTSRYVVIVDPFSTGAKLAGALRKVGLEPICVTSHRTPSAAYTAAFRPQDFPAVYTAALRPQDFAAVFTAGVDLSVLVEQLAEFRPLAVVPGAETGVLLADALAAMLTPELANAPNRTMSRRHKGDMVNALIAKGVPAIRSVCVSDPLEAVRWVERQGLRGRDLVVKPATATATQGVTLLRNGEGLESSISALLGQPNLMRLVNDEVVVQERVCGTEYVVDTFSHDGRHTVTNICRYHKVANGSAFAVYESIEFLPYEAPDNPSLIDYVELALDALGIKFGLAHSEVMLTSDGPLLIETGARSAGAGLPSLCELATGDSGIGRLARYLAGETDVRQDFTLDWHVTAVYFIAPRSGRLDNVAAYDKARQLPSCRHLQINIKDGDLVPATTDLMSTMSLGWAVLAHSDPDQVRRDHAAFREIEHEVRIREPTGTTVVPATAGAAGRVDGEGPRDH